MECKSWRPKGFAKRHNVSPAFVYKQIAEGKLKARKAGKATIITDDNEADWIAQMRVIGAASDHPDDDPDDDP
jgi:hypothetical protein